MAPDPALCDGVLDYWFSLISWIWRSSSLAAGNCAGFTGEAGLPTSYGGVVVSCVLAPLFNIQTVWIYAPAQAHTHTLSREVFQVSVRAVNPRRMTGQLPQIGFKAAHFTLWWEAAAAENGLDWRADLMKSYDSSLFRHRESKVYPEDDSF